MNWNEAVEAMKRGEKVMRMADCGVCKIGEADIRELGMEPAMLAHAWTVDEKPALVFMGAFSKALFVPGSDHRAATDWCIHTDARIGPVPDADREGMEEE
jgi:hypothetical protein